VGVSSTTEQIQLAIHEAASWAAHMAVIEGNCRWLLGEVDEPALRAQTTARLELAVEMRERFEQEVAAWRALLVQRPEMVRPGKTGRAVQVLERVRRATASPC
jgi:hypothetical protein